ncbi:tripartite tricarboxylate transporter TctB family protein [Halomonas citrativorans]|uniref:Tripartite tricarboxylate transporter TctB family protein n=1 Tax=Halomonas citrativorans TaxID=2742612 RepID=A0ABR9FA23_9GAMM|nr:tripartite tricarboxylate transporter TctB family protein [Halomonas citrativorans]MBE0403348.1 tripartite tricarboxylate transporter TctB family protein [Halomonas citrativorans]
MVTGKISATHAFLLGLVLAIAGFITWSATQASTTLNNLVVVAPTAIIIGLLSIGIVAKTLLKPATEPSSSSTDKSSIWSDILLLAGFSAFCFALTNVGFDVATFVFVWVGVLMCGSKGKWQPPLYALVFTVFLVKGFGSLFPYPMTTLVL